MVERILGQLGFILEAQEAPKSRPKPQKIDVKKQYIFGIDFGRVRTSFWKGFWKGFWTEHAWKSQKHEFNKNLKNNDFPKENLYF